MSYMTFFCQWCLDITINSKNATHRFRPFLGSYDECIAKLHKELEQGGEFSIRLVQVQPGEVEV